MSIKKILLTIAGLTALHQSFAQDEKQPSCINSKGEINTEASIDAKTEMLHTTRHHWKFEFWRGAVCIGRPDDQAETNETNKQNSSACAGDLVYTTKKGGFHNYTPVKISWGANLTENDVFKVQFTQDTKAVEYGNEGSSKCTTHKYATKLSAYEGKFSANARVEIPRDVWILAIRTVRNKNHNKDLPTYIGRTAEGTTKGHKIPLKDTWKYLYVQPGEKIDLLVENTSNDLQSNIKFDVDFEFRFVGHNRCEELLGRYDKFNYSPENVKSIILQNPKTEDERNFYALRLGCLRNQAYMQAGMANSRPDFLLPIMETLQAETQKMVSLIKEKDTLSEVEKGNMRFLNDIMEMTLLDMGRFAMNDLLAYCQTYKDFTREGVRMGQVDAVPGIEYSTLTYHRIQMMLDRFPVLSVKEFADRMTAWENNSISYRSLMRGGDEVKNSLKVFQSDIMRYNYEGFRKTAELINVLPQTTINSTERKELLVRLDHANQEAAVLESEIIASLYKFSSRKSDIVSSKLIRKYSQRLTENVESIRAAITAHMAWYIANDKQSGFISDVGTISREYVEAIGLALDQSVGDRNLTSFVQQDQLKILIGKMNKCLNEAGGSL